MIEQMNCQNAHLCNFDNNTYPIHSIEPINFKMRIYAIFAVYVIDPKGHEYMSEILVSVLSNG